MGIVDNALAGASGNQGAAYNIERSLRFRSSASAYLNRTPASAGNRRTFTWSGWVKLGLIDLNYRSLFANGNAVDSMVFWNDNTFALTNFNGTSYVVRTTQVFRDPSAWYHLVIAFDTTQATASNRIKIYVNGAQVTNFATSTYPSQNYDTGYNTATIQYIAYNEYNRFEGYLAELNWIDGQALTPSSFGETDTITGVWKPKKYTGTYGTNGFYLKFNNLTSTSTLGNDSSGNGNTWTVNNVSLTAGTTYDSMTDVPTLTSATAANYAVLNPIGNSIAYSITNGNLSISNGSSQRGTKPASFFLTSGKWYWEAAGNGYVGAVCGNNGATFAGSASSTGSNAIGYWEGGIVYWDGGNSGTGASYTSSDIIGIALDMGAGTVAFYKNNSLQYTATFGSGTVPNLSSGCFPCYNDGFSMSAKSADFNFGQRPFAYTPPSGFVALNTFNLPTPTIGATASTQANDYFDVTLYTGNGTARNIINSGSMQPDLVWLKSRVSSVWNHQLYDVLRSPLNSLSSNTADATYTYTDTLTAFNSNGFSLGTDATWNGPVNKSGDTYVAWQWKANGAGSSNTAGSISSTVSANTSAGFSIVTYTGTGANATVGHGLGVAPKFIIIKNRTAAAQEWQVLHQSANGGSGHLGALFLNLTAAWSSGGYFGNTAPTSTVFSLDGSSYANGSGNGIVAYCWSEIAGFSRFGSYTGNGSTDGVFVYLGFRPSFIMIKKSSSTGNWMMFDSKRLEYNGSSASKELYPNLSLAEGTSNGPDELSNGFKLRDNYSDINTNGDTYIYAAFAENPFKNSLAR